MIRGHNVAVGRNNKSAFAGEGHCIHTSVLVAGQASDLVLEMVSEENYASAWERSVIGCDCMHCIELPLFRSEEEKRGEKRKGEKEKGRERGNEGGGRVEWRGREDGRG